MPTHSRITAGRLRSLASAPANSSSRRDMWTPTSGEASCERGLPTCDLQLGLRATRAHLETDGSSILKGHLMEQRGRCQAGSAISTTCNLLCKSAAQFHWSWKRPPLPPLRGAGGKAPGRTPGHRRSGEQHLVQGERVECVVLHRDVVHLVGLQGHPSQGPVGLLAQSPRQAAPEVSVLALAELSVLQGLQDGHLRNCTGWGRGRGMASAISVPEMPLPAPSGPPPSPLRLPPASQPQFLKTGTLGTALLHT